MSEINFAALTKLADLLDTVPDEKFHYASWAGHEFNGALTAPECGTTACALGWATAIPEFGLVLRRLPSCYGGDAERGVPGVCLVGEAAIDPAWESSPRAARKVFGLSHNEVEWLFSPSDVSPVSSDPDGLYDGYEEDFAVWGCDGKPTDFAGPKVVAKHIRDFISVGGIPE